MLYLKMSSQDFNVLIMYCKNCGLEINSADPSSGMKSVVVMRRQITQSEKSFDHMFNDWTKYDPTIPRTNKVLCPNKDCVSNERVKKEEEEVGQKAVTADNYDLKRDIPNSEESSMNVIAPALLSAAVASVDSSLGPANREVLIFRVDDIQMKYIFYCAKCDHRWQTMAISGSF